MNNKANAVIRLLLGRKGFGGWWHNLEGDLQAEIMEAINKTLDAYEANEKSAS